MRKILFSLLCLLVAGGTGFAAAPADFTAANNLYDKGDFKAARAAYETLVKSGNWSAHLFYNLGNAAYREGDKGAAILAYERALALEPGHPEAKANLGFLRDATGARIPKPSWMGRALEWPAANEAAWLAAAAAWGLCFSVAPLVWKSRVARGPALGCALLLAWSGAVLAWQHNAGDPWIVTAEKASARTMPADNSPSLAPLPVGSHVQLILERGPWLNIQLPDGSRGWISSSAVSVLKP